MRFHQLTFCNLKSLKGTYKLDLDLEFGSEELFLIFGEMGTGKTTIFDAISLALFGFTPKLRSSFSSSNNDSIRHILNEESKSCSVDLIFSFLNKEFFKASWSFRLTNSGNAVAPTRSLERLNDKFTRMELLYSGQQVGPANAIFSKTLHGLEFEDFIRSILLPQGGFAKFIEARPKDRIEILERITNTIIYADISQKAAQIRGQKKKAHTVLEEQIRGLPTIDEVRNMRIHQTENVKKISYLKRKREVMSFSHTWSTRSENSARAQLQQEHLEEQHKSIREKYSRSRIKVALLRQKSGE